MELILLGTLLFCAVYNLIMKLKLDPNLKNTLLIVLLIIAIVLLVWVMLGHSVPLIAHTVSAII